MAINIIKRENIPCIFDADALQKLLHIRAGSAYEREFQALLQQAQERVNARYIVAEAEVTAREAEAVEVAGMRFTSRVLAVNLENSKTVYPFACTCGMELEEWGRGFDDALVEFWVEGIKQFALRKAIEALHLDLQTQFAPGHVSTMSPGSLENWPISQQKPLFALLENPPEVQLSESMLMIPTKSVSGIIFTTDASFESCQLCPRDDCPNRRAPYDETLFEKQYHLAE